MIWVTDSMTKNRVAINPTYVVAVFRIPETTEAQKEYVGKTAINMTNSTIVVDEPELEVVGMMQ
jgi:hypothetical protein